MADASGPSTSRDEPSLDHGASNTVKAGFVFPKSHSFPPMYTIQPNPVTRTAQFQKWSRTIQLYCQHHRIFRLEFPASFESPLFVNTTIHRRVEPDGIKQILDCMALDSSKEKNQATFGVARGAWIYREAFWVYWKRPEEWADLIYRWVESIGQKGSVLTFYELLEGEATVDQDFHKMDPELFNIAMNHLMKRGKAQVFGNEDSRGVKFF